MPRDSLVQCDQLSIGELRMAHRYSLDVERIHIFPMCSMREKCSSRQRAAVGLWNAHRPYVPTSIHSTDGRITWWHRAHTHTHRFEWHTKLTSCVSLALARAMLYFGRCHLILSRHCDAWQTTCTQMRPSLMFNASAQSHGMCARFIHRLLLRPRAIVRSPVFVGIAATAWHSLECVFMFWLMLLLLWYFNVFYASHSILFSKLLCFVELCLELPCCIHLIAVYLFFLSPLQCFMHTETQAATVKKGLHTMYGQECIFARTLHAFKTT